MTNYSPLLALFALAPRLRRASNRAVSIYLPARSEGYDARFYDIEFRDLLHRGGTTIVVETTVRDANGKLVAKVTQTQLVLRAVNA